MMKLVWLLSYLSPIRLLYFFADFMAATSNYRSSVIIDNLKRSFPELSKKEIQSLKKGFYTRFFEFIVETFKMISLKKETVMSNVKFENDDELIRDLEKQSVFMLASHIIPWEVQGIAISGHHKNPLLFSYQQLSNKFFDKLMLSIRSKFGAIGFERDKMTRILLNSRDKKQINYILPDQSPSGKAKRYRTLFLNQETAFFYGVGQIISKTQLPVYGVYTKRIKRGKYVVHFEKLLDNNSGAEPEEVLEAYIQFLEKTIKNQPDNWLWSHKRWKRERREDDIFSKKIQK